MSLTALPRIAVFASGRGSNLDAILGAIRDRKLSAEVVAVVSDQPEAPALEKARKAGIPAICVRPDSSLPLGQRRDRHEEMILEQILPLRPRFIVLAGYRRVVTPRLIEAFRSERGYSRIVNVHPSLLPAFPGVDSYRQAFEHGAHLSGVTVHLVELQVDDGPICAQEAFSIRDCRSVEEVEKRGLLVEHRLYPEALGWILPEKFAVEESSPRRIRVRSN